MNVRSGEEDGRLIVPGSGFHVYSPRLLTEEILARRPPDTRLELGLHFARHAGVGFAGESLGIGSSVKSLRRFTGHWSWRCSLKYPRTSPDPQLVAKLTCLGLPGFAQLSLSAQTNPLSFSAPGVGSAAPPRDLLEYDAHRHATPCQAARLGSDDLEP